MKKNIKSTKKEYSVIIGGAAGQGSRKAGLIIAKLFNKLGYNIYIYEEYQSLIRGGHNFSQITASEKEITNRKQKIDFLLALDKKTIQKHKENIKKDGLLFFNSNKIEEKGVGIAADKIVKELDGLPIMANIALIAGLAKTIGIDWSILKKILEEEIGKELEKNLKVAENAFHSVSSLLKIEKTKNNPKLLMTGNEAIARGMAKAGLDIYFAYPMTPASSILHYFSAHQKETKIIAVQSENEIAVASEAVGAAFAGKRSAVASSGGGFALMTETISLAAQAEIPFMVINSQRMGPATGVPTYGGQSDLLFSLWSGHGDFEKFVVAPSDAEESFYWAGKLLNLCWQYQTPSILLTEKDISEGTFSVNKEVLAKVKKEKELLWNGKGDYERYKITSNGISPLAYPGAKNAIVKANSYEHNEKGYSEEESKEMIKAMQSKRLAKFKLMEQEVDLLESVKIYGNKKSKTAVVAWGLGAIAARTAVETLGLKLIQPIVLAPFPTKQIKKAFNGVEKVICVEVNALGQMAILLEGHGVKIDKKILKYDSTPFLSEELEKQINSIK
jgi:2-oxoglutarate ferredoxin oxidoreductase subunit alpha